MESLKDASSLFKKRAKQVKESFEPSPPPVVISPIVKTRKFSDYNTENELTKISEYEEQLHNYLDKGEYQYVLDKASELGLLDFVDLLLNQSEKEELYLRLDKALESASYYGHLDIVERLLDSDVNTERYMGINPRPKVEPFLFFEGKSEIPYVNVPLTHDNIRKAMLNATLAKHDLVFKILEKYYYRTHAVKDRHDIEKMKKYLVKN